MNKNEAQTGSLPEPHVGPVGECGLLFTFAPQQEQTLLPVPLSVQQRVWALSTWLQERRQELHLREIVPGMGNLLLVTDPFTSHASLADTVLSLWPSLQPGPGSGRTVEIPVHYGSGSSDDEDGPDLGRIAAHTGLSIAEIIRRHSEATYRVYCLGFQPGFAYLAGLDPSLATPRRDSPRIRTPAGSVAIGGNQTGIYPSTGPGGWQIIGRTSLTLFDPHRDSPSLLQPGDSVHFIPGGRV